MGRERVTEVVWRNEEKKLSLDGEEVLWYRLSWPWISGEGRGPQRLDRGYERMAARWRDRWQREVYVEACLDMGACRAQSKPFVPWKLELGGEVTVLEPECLGLKLWASEDRGAGQIDRICWGDVWKLPEGTPLQLQEVLRGQRGWKKGLRKQLFNQRLQKEKSSEEGGSGTQNGWRRKFPRLEEYLLYADQVGFFDRQEIQGGWEDSIHWVPRPGKEK